MTAIIDYDAGNLKSVEKAFLALGDQPVVSRDAQVILGADRVVLPGVGSFGDAMEKLHQYGLVPVIRQVVEKKTPFLGICLGLQLLFEGSDEGEDCEGLSLLPGRILRIPPGPGRKIPHMGWNSLDITPGARLFQGVPEGAYVYFVHSYYLQADDPSAVAASTEYGVHIHAAVEKGNLFACQFHPEKSGQVGLQILRNFIQLEGSLPESTQRS